MQTIILTRLMHLEVGIIGRFSAPQLGQTLWAVERSWEANHNMNSCIPEGIYPLKPHSGEKFQNVWEVTNVVGRSAILLHPANRPTELLGCIAPCSNYKLVAMGKPSAYKAEGIASRAACSLLFRVIQAMHDAGGAQLKVTAYRSTFQL
jgi:hypothetical protein